MIENPEVPGFEQNLPPMPPPEKKTKEPNVPSEVVSNLQSPIPPGVTIVNSQAVFPALTPGYYIPTQEQPQPVGQEVPWWIPNENDGLEPYQWFDQNQINNLFNNPTDDKTKCKNLKRKAESTDHALDAEKVASAQRDLAALMKPLKCDLCNAVMNSTPQAKLHYEGKPHQKKVAMFLSQCVKKIKSDDKQVTSTSANDWNNYCETCKTWFTSQTDAAQHYAGKKHIRATTGIPIPKSGKKNINQIPVDPTGRFGIGLSFPTPETQVQLPIMEVPTTPVVVTGLSQVSQVSPLPTTPMYAPGATTYGAALRCELCGISTNRLDQLENHKRGTRHIKMLRQNGLLQANSVAMMENQPQAPTIDYSIYRTPSGSYYCAPCNKSFNSENSFAQHVESKKHKNQQNQKSQTNQTSKLLTKKSKIKKTKSS